MDLHPKFLWDREQLKISRLLILFIKSQQLVAFAKEVGLISSLASTEMNSESREVMKNLINVGLMPVEKIKEAVAEIIKLIEIKFINETKLKTRWTNFMNAYFVPVWMKGITPEVFSVYGSVDRTNDFIKKNEDYYKSIVGMKTAYHPFFCKYLRN